MQNHALEYEQEACNKRTKAGKQAGLDQPPLWKQQQQQQH